MNIESEDKNQEQSQVKQPHSTEELRKRAIEALEKANQVLRETGKHQESETPGQGDTTQ